jgi:TrpR-related protein YerC/YecD
MENWDNNKTKDLFKVILKLKNVGEAKKFFRDLLTEEELIEFGKRWQVAQMLDKNISYKKINLLPPNIS